MLAQRPQIELQLACSGLEGLAQAQILRPQLILLDLELPDLGGIELLQRLRADAALASIPVVVVSAYAQADMVAAALEAGAVDYLSKPFELQALLRIVDRQFDVAHTVI